MSRKGTRILTLGAVHFVGLAALAFATPAHAVDEPSPTVPSAAAPSVPSAWADQTEPQVASPADPEISSTVPKIPGEMTPSAPATAQLERIRQGWSQVISPKHAQKSPVRASAGSSWHRAVIAPSQVRQYHRSHVQYQRPPSAVRKTGAIVLQPVSFPSREATAITRSSAPIRSEKRSQNGVRNCAWDSNGNWSPDLPADDEQDVQCAADSPTDEPLIEDPANSSACSDEGTQYQPDEPQYQAPVSTICGASDDSVIPIALPDAQVPTSSESSAAPAAPIVISPTTEVAAVPVVAEPGADALPVLEGPAPVTTKVRPRGQVEKPSRPTPASPRLPQTSERFRPEGARSASATVSLPLPRLRTGTPRTRPTTLVSRSRLLAALPQLVEPASSRVNLFGGWLVLVLPFVFVFAFGLLLPVVVIAARSLRARMGSKGLSDPGVGAKSSTGIRYRE
jgi:hypothetical protein